MSQTAQGTAVTPRWEQVGLNEEEYQRIVSLLGREPNDLELGLYGVMWSEHCSYKSSRVHLRKFPTQGERVLVGPGENAGVLDLGDGMAIAVRCESHNHPSAIEPYQGAATGVGGILRDIFTMGARPVALLDSLRFGSLKEGKETTAARAARNRYLVAGVVGGIADYGNSVGVPTVGGEVYFDECYNENPLVNVMCVGLMRKDRIVRGRAEGEGNPVYLVGSRTGRDGIHGASLLASQEFTEAAEEMRPAVQVGDPFMEKLLIEACLELMETDAVVGVNDLGAAGMTSALSETASRAGSGVEVEIANVPRREEGMTPYEVMLSESQERMLVIVHKGRESEVEAIFRRWGLQAACIGRVTTDGRLRIKENGVVVADLPAYTLTDEAPAYDRPSRRPAYIDERQRLDPAQVQPPAGKDGVEESLIALLASPNIASKSWIFRQYDYMVRTSTVVEPGADAAVLRVRGSRSGVALATDCNSRFCYLDPYTGGAMAVAEAARNVACTGAKPIGLTNCLNFASPERPETMWQFQQVIEGMSDACRALGIPVTGGNVSFYNETLGRPIYPTPVIGMVGLLEDIDNRLTTGFDKAGDMVALLGGLPGDEGLAGSEYLKVRQGLVAGRPVIDLDAEARLQRLLVAAAGARLLSSAHDISEGGLAVTLAECAFHGKEGARGVAVEVAGLPAGCRVDSLLFGESASRVVVSLPEERLPELSKMAEREGVPLLVLGCVGGDNLRVAIKGETVIDRPVAELFKVWGEALTCLMQ